MKSFALFAAICAVALSVETPKTANAATVDFHFSFSDPIGTVTGVVEGLSNSTTGPQPASAVLLESFPASLGSICSTPCNMLASPPWIVTVNQFDVVNGQVTFADFISTLGNAQFLFAPAVLGSLRGTNESAVTGLTTFTETPLPATLPLFATALGALGLFGWRRKRKARVSLLGAA